MERIAGRFVLVRRLGGGDASAVYLGRDEALDRPVAVRVLDPTLADPEGGARFRREGRAAARLSHPNTVRVYDVEEAPVDGRGTFLIVMEYVSGGDLGGLVDRSGPLPLPMLSRIGSDVAAGLAHAHERGVVHGDVAPRNVLIDGYGSPKLADFGIARALGVGQPSGSSLGTAASYASPERLRGEKLTPKSDVYSLGATLYQAATGRPPFSGGPMEVAGQQIEGVPVPPRERGAAIGRRFEALILGCLSRDPASRPDASHLHERLLQTGAAAGATATAPASNGSVGAGAAGEALRNVGSARKASPAGVAGLSRAAGAAKAAGLAGLAGARAVGQRFDRRGGERPDGPPETTITVPTRTFQSGAHQRNLLALLAAALVLLLLLLGVVWTLWGPGGAEEQAANPPAEPRADAPQRDKPGEKAEVPAQQGAGGDNGDRSGASDGASDGASGVRTEEAPGPVPPPARAERAVYNMYVNQSYQRVDATWNALSGRLQGEVGSPERWAAREDIYTFAYMEYVSVPTATVSGDTARVYFEARLDHTWGSELLSGTWVCVVEDGEWKLDRLENEIVQPA